ncbi:leukotriene-A4 hydrolase [Malassezia yamatoensis]|uniref:tRNA dimethylallyltransferase n=1 Tax=Malassezia yamatoensis TaxID=253288 RepID=A0AAJ5YUJ5_9BASI|nr:leukotriene-A4 hydrolase [Malassezia yamatoensis]
MLLYFDAGQRLVPESDDVRRIRRKSTLGHHITTVFARDTLPEWMLRRLTRTFSSLSCICSRASRLTSAPVPIKGMSEKSWAPPAPDAVPAPPQGPIHDRHSLSNLNELLPKRLHLDWFVDWENRRIHGSVTHTFRVLKQNPTQAIFDTSYLAIDKVQVDGQPTEFELKERCDALGQPLVVELGNLEKDAEIQIQISYSTTDQCTALGWLAREQTHAKTHPFLYSQCQAIHARSLLPCFDAPGRKITYTAQVTSSIPVLMSALQDRQPKDLGNGTKQYFFKQPVSIPSYLLAIVGGDLEFRSLGPRTGVWAEPPDADAVQWEFEQDAERFLKEAEELVSPYSWTRYDSVVLPPSFPYGGMENANLTTLTPSLVCGDRSATDVLLHELCHSWSGNLTSCVNWDSFWLNEGWTVYLERLLLQKLYGEREGPAHRGFSYIIGARSLRSALQGFESKPRFQRLIPEYESGEDPDDAFSSIPYEKGSNFLLYLERIVGGLEVFEPYIKAYFRAFYDRAVSTDDWKSHLYAFYADNQSVIDRLNQVDWDAWLHGEGMKLPVSMEYDASLAKDAYKLAEEWNEAVQQASSRADVKRAFSQDDMRDWNANQKVVFLEQLQSNSEPLPKYAVQWLDEAYDLANNANDEIPVRFFELALAVKNSGYEQKAADWVKDKGRMKYCRAVFKALYKADPDLARKSFKENQSFYHPIAAAMIRKVRISMALYGAGTLVVWTDTNTHVVAIIGSTGTGKSQLGVDLAQLYDAEIISADSMQTYQGLDVITNKAPVEDMRGVPHHLLSFLTPQQEYDITQFVTDARHLCASMHQRNTLPILVGGTTYYLQHLLFPGRLVSKSCKDGSDSISKQSSVQEQLSPEQRAIWDAIHQDHDVDMDHITSESLWDLLHALDEASAARWHYRDRRKILRSLRILKQTGTRQSDWVHQQDASASQPEIPSFAKRRLVLWVWSERETLCKRLDQRITEMIKRGLLNEIQALRAIAKQHVQQEVDYTRGIYQAIGYKEFDAYLSLQESNGSQQDLQLVFHQAIQAMQVATRRYAKRQISWIRNQLLPAIYRAQNRGEEVYIYVLDATDPEQWDRCVRRPAESLTAAFLKQEPMPNPETIFAQATELLATHASEQGPIERNQMQVCEICTTDSKTPFLVRTSDMPKHLQSRTHRTAIKRQTRQAWIHGNKQHGEKIRRERAAKKQALLDQNASSEP